MSHTGRYVGELLSYPIDRGAKYQYYVVTRVADADHVDVVWLADSSMSPMFLKSRSSILFDRAVMTFGGPVHV